MSEMASLDPICYQCPLSSLLQEVYTFLTVGLIHTWSIYTRLHVPSLPRPNQEFRVREAQNILHSLNSRSCHLTFQYYTMVYSWNFI
jgi:hypothetical protein